MPSNPTKTQPLNPANPFFDVIAMLQKEFNSHRQFSFSLNYIAQTGLHELVVDCELDVGKFSRSIVQYHHKFEIDEAMIVRMDATELVGFYFEIMQDFVLCMDEEDTGVYPLHRVYVDNHLNKMRRPLFGSPDQKIEGWQFHKMRGKTWLDRKTPKHVMGIQKVVKGIVEPDEDGLARFKPFEEMDTEAQLKHALVDRLIPIDDEGAKLMADVTKKKRVVTRNTKPPIDPSKVKKPLCPQHATAMEYDPVRGKWKCKVAGCKLVALPERDADDKSVVLGKGEITLRVVMAKGEPTVLLISDDNVALNITKFVDVEEIVNQWDLGTVAEAAAEEGRENFVVPIEKAVDIKSVKVGVIGASDLVAFTETF